MLGIWRLQLLREVARRGTIRAAAGAMSITPSAVSQQLRILESEAGVPLLERRGRLVRLTDAGEMLVRHADAITAAITAAESELASTQHEIAGTLRVAAIPTAARAVLPAAIASLGRAHPRLRLMLRDLETAESLPALATDEVDLAVVDEYDEATRIREPGIELLDLLTEPIFVALPPGHPAGGGPVPLAGLRDEAWIMDTEASGISRALVRACRREGFDPHVRSNCRDYSVIIALVEAGLGVAALPGLALRDREIRARVAPVHPPLERRVRIAVKPERRGHPAVAAMLAELQRVVAAAPGSGIVQDN
ncbi:MAG: LysR family transcriptional regulator [Candidatus Limnocylindrales bacterium]